MKKLIHKYNFHVKKNENLDFSSVHWLELFYDVIQSITISLISIYLINHLNLQGFIFFVILFSSLWFSWFDLSIYNSLYLSTDLYYRFLLIINIVSLMCIAGALGLIQQNHLELFMIGYGVNRLIICFLYLRVAIYETQKILLPKITTIFYGLVGIIIIFIALINNYYLEFSAIILNILIMIFMYSPFGFSKLKNFDLRLDHISKRFARLFLISAGAGFSYLIVGVNKIGLHKLPGSIIAGYILGAIAIFALCTKYFDSAADKTPKKERLFEWIISHFIIMFSLIIISISLNSEIRPRYFYYFNHAFAILGSFGILLFFLSLFFIKNSINIKPPFHVTNSSIAISLATITLIINIIHPSIYGNSLWILIIIIQAIISLYLKIISNN
ncbi:MAG: low temperature requirement protein A [Psittacicella sp.]